MRKLNSIPGRRFVDDSCGKSTPKSSKPKAKKSIAAAEAALGAAVRGFLDDFVKALELDPAEVTDPAGWRYFGFGSAFGRAGVVEADSRLYLLVEAPVIDLPSDGELILPLMRELLELNSSLVGPTRLAISGGQVLACLSYPVAGLLTAEDVSFCLGTTVATADALDDELTATYGGTVRRRR